MKDKKLYMIGNAHLDPVWLWNWQEGFAEVKATFRSALDRMKEDPDFIFTSSSARHYEWVEKNCPEMFCEIKERVREGRWEIVGGWIVQPDCNLPCGESFARQSLYGQRYFKEKFGVQALVGYCVDSFGHSISLPQILSKSGMKNYVFMRPKPHEKNLPGRVFRWQSPDGSEVLCYQIPYEYLSERGSLEPNIRRLEPELEENDALMLFYGVGNHGGGPTKENLRSIHELNEREDLPELLLSSVGAFFEDIRSNGKEYPLVTEDLQHHASGCYSACSRVKQENRKAEELLLAAERWSSIARLEQNQHTEHSFKDAWKGVLFNQFHDILAGTSIPSAYDDAGAVFGKATAQAQENLNYALQAVSWSIDIEENVSMKPIVVFNPHAFNAKLAVERETCRLNEGEFFLTDENGEPVPAQIVRSEAVVTDRSRLLFTAELPSLGYRVYKLWLKRGEKSFDAVCAGETSLENGLLRLELDEKTGAIKSLFDKRNGVELFAAPAARPVVVRDMSDTWSHDVFRYDDELGGMKLQSICVSELGPVRSALRVRYSFNDSLLMQEFRLYRDEGKIEVTGKVEWKEPNALLKLHFPVAVSSPRLTYGAPYSFIEKKPNGEEEPVKDWLDVSGEAGGMSYGLSLCTDRTSCAVENNDIALTVLRGTVYAHHIPAVLEDGVEYLRTEEGVQHFRYDLLPHGGAWGSDTVECAQMLTQKAVSVPETYHTGTRGQKASFAGVTRCEVMLTVIKEAEDKDGIILRAVELTGKPVSCVISVLGRELPLDFIPNEIKTVKLADNGEVYEVDLVENMI